MYIFLSSLFLSFSISSYFISLLSVSSCLVLSCLVLSCLVLSCLVLSCLVLFCLVLFCLVISHYTLSCCAVQVNRAKGTDKQSLLLQMGKVGEEVDSALKKMRVIQVGTRTGVESYGEASIRIIPYGILVFDFMVSPLL